MGIRILDKEEADDGARSIALVEMDDPDTNDTSKRWQFVCELCQEFRTDLTEKEARDAFANHTCKVLQEYDD